MDVAKDDVAVTPVTDAEQWSDETERSGDETRSNATPEGYQALRAEDDDSLPAWPGEGWREGGEDRWEDGGDGDGGGGNGGDVASLLLQAMDADYQACIESERIISNGPVQVDAAGPATSDYRPESASVSGHEQRDEQEERWNPGDDVDKDGGGVDGGVGEATVAVSPRPISPLGRDQAERVMRAMQGFALAPPPIPPDWGSAGAIASLSLGGSDEERKEGVSRPRDGPEDS